MTSLSLCCALTTSHSQTIQIYAFNLLAINSEKQYLRGCMKWHVVSTVQRGLYLSRTLRLFFLAPNNQLSHSFAARTALPESLLCLHLCIHSRQMQPVAAVRYKNRACVASIAPLRTGTRNHVLSGHTTLLPQPSKNAQCCWTTLECERVTWGPRWCSYDLERVISITGRRRG